MVQIETARTRSMNDTRNRILDVALTVLGQNPDAGMGDVASAAGVVRRTVYGHFPTRGDLVRTLAQRASDEVAAVLSAVNAPDGAADAVWADFIARLWPLAHRYRVLLALRRGEYGAEIHALLGPVDTVLADLVHRGQDTGAFGRHLPPQLLSQIAFSAVFTIADDHQSHGTDQSHGTFDARAAIVTSLLILGVPEPRAHALLS